MREFVCVQFSFNFTVVVFRFVDENRIQESVRQRFSGNQNQFGILIINWLFDHRRNGDDITEKRIAKTSVTTAYKLHNPIAK
jgi:hypothetical protein